MKNKRVCIVTGARSDYAYLKPIIDKVMLSSTLELCVFVTGIHLLKEFGETIDYIKKDGIPITEVVNMYDLINYRSDFLGEYIGNAIINFTKAFLRHKPDILLILGDRYEALAATISASTLRIVIAHAHGGDNVIQGKIDEQIRHAITKLAHIHFPATFRSAERIKLMGEEGWRIHMVGSPTIDTILNEKIES